MIADYWMNVIGGGCREVALLDAPATTGMYFNLVTMTVCTHYPAVFRPATI
jgi:hypothetical protein